MKKSIDDIEILLEKFSSLGISSVIDFHKFNQYSITHHSTTIEGSTLTEVEVELLLDEGITPAGKPLLHTLMVKDHFEALQFIQREADKKTAITPSFICSINAHAMKNTGSIYNTVFGEIDASKGMFRKGNVRAGNTYFVNYDKVEALVTKLCEQSALRISKATTFKEKLELSFDVHFELVTIHPFYDGNGRSSRLLMNYIQAYFQLPLSIVFKEDKALYFETLIETRKKEDINIFRSFMYDQYAKYLEKEIEAFENIKTDKKGNGFSFLF